MIVWKRRSPDSDPSQAWAWREYHEEDRGQFLGRTDIVLLLTALALLLFLLLAPPLRQDQGYHSFADQRTLLGIRNFWDVVSNVPFAIVGLMGLFAFRDLASRIIFLGIFSTAFGSAYYHLTPDNARLFWDRLPMTIVFMALFALAIKQRGLVIPLVIVGIASAVWWKLADNLWPYALVQFGPLIALVVIAIRREPLLRPVVVFYGLSKITEYFDKQIYSVFSVSGHTLKHLLAAIATWYVLRWIQSPKATQTPPPTTQTSRTR